MVEVPAVRVAQTWIEAVNSGDAQGAWRLMDPELRLTLVQEWLDWGGPNLLAVKTRGRDAVTTDLASDEPRLMEFEVLADRLFVNWEPRLHEIRSCVAIDGDPIAEDVREVLLAAVASGGRQLAVMRQTEGGWRVAAFGGRSLPRPGSPPVLGSTIGAGQAPVRRTA